jgi:hypothetical protein
VTSTIDSARTFRLAVWTLITMGSSGLLAGSTYEALAAASPGPRKVEFNRDIRPILSENCNQCHGPDKNKRKAKLRLDQRASAVSTKAIVPGKPDESELVTRIQSTDADEVMPPPSSRKALTAPQKKLLEQWIAEGAEYQSHWAYVSPHRPTAPSVNRTAWVHNPVDAFILAGLEARGIKPSPEADRPTLIRRLSLDITGLPPTPDEVQDFAADTKPDAYERLVDRLLRSPHYGERMAVAWLDLVRFTDTVGYHGDQNQRIFPYRDYVIDSFNANKPFDQFTLEQIAGDLLPNPTPEQLVATGFNRLNMMTREGGAQPGEYLAKYAGDRVRTVGITWLGTTLGCCECHDHKYDPFTMRDFYSLQAFFADVKQWGVYQDYDYTPNPDLKGCSNDHPFPPEIEVQSPYLLRRLEQLRGRIREIAGRFAPRDPAGTQAIERWLAQTARFVDSAPSGWRTPSVKLDPAAGSGAKIQPDGSVLLSSPAGKAGDAWIFRMNPGAGGLARIRLELLPHESHGGKITRSGAEGAVVHLEASVAPGGGKSARKLAVFHAEAEAGDKEPRYVNGYEVLGVLDGWYTAKKKSASRQAAVWYLDQPMRLESDDELIVTVKSDRAGCVRLSVSPFGFDPGGRVELDPELARTLRSATTLAKFPPPLRAEIEQLHLFATGQPAGAFAESKGLCREILECRDGRTLTMVTQSTTPMVVHVLPRGNWQDTSGPIVEPAVPLALPQPPRVSGRRLDRIDLARWLTAPQNPLTARVFANRLWKQFFGTGISSLVEDVGAQGEWPVHPELLDWLAVEFRESGWNIKHMIKTLTMSSAYRQDSRLRPDLRELDPNNRLVASQSPRRLEAEFVRDNALAIAGLIKLDVGGPSVFPYQPEGYYANLQFPDRDYIASRDERQYRRGVYMHWQRTFLHPMLLNFDASPREECTAARTVANTPQQALTLLNDTTFVEAARVLAGRLLATPAKSDAERIALLYRRALARAPRSAEGTSMAAFLAEERSFFRSHRTEAVQLVHVGFAPDAAPRGTDPAELAAWTTACRVVLNLHETITKY